MAGKPYQLRMPEELHADLRHFSVDCGRSMNEIVVEVLEVWWKERNRKGVRAKTAVADSLRRLADRLDREGVKDAVENV